MLVSVCFFLSGAAALILQVLWTRMLGHVFGATALAVSTTLTAFMGGLALGAHLAGRIAPRLKRPLLTFALLETGVGLYGLLVPSLLALMPAVQRWMGIGLGTHFIAYSLVRFVIVTLILIVPTTAMGATLPILAEGVVKTGKDVASKVGELFAANTFGAVAGAFSAGFVLIPTFGITVTVRIAAAIDLLVAIAVVSLWRIARGERLLLAAARLDTPDAVLAMLEPAPAQDVTPRTQRAALLAFALSGGAAMSLEVLWTRAIGVVIGASTHAFTLILCTFLVGLSVGAAWMTRRIDRVTDPVRKLAWVQVAVGVLAMLGTVLVDRMPHLLAAAARSRDVTMSFIYFSNFAIAALVMLPAALALGTVMPLVVRILAPEGADHAGPIVAKAYTLNTLGAIVGSFAGGFVLLPMLGVEHGLALAAAINLAVGALLALARPERVWRAPIVAAIAGVTLLLLPKWDVPSWTAGMFRFYLPRNVYTAGWEWKGKLLYHRDGIASTVTVEGAEDGDGVSLKVNGKVDASDYGDMPTQILSGLLPILAHPQAERVLVIGFGSGVTSGAVLEAPVKSLDLVEIESAVLEASRQYFAHVNHDPFEDPRFRAIVDDGRNYLLSRDQLYDVIISEPSNPWMSGAASLFTADFFRIARARLAGEGVFLQWLQLYELAPENIQTLFSTFRSVFPYVAVFSPSARSNDTLVLGGNQPIRLDRGRIAAALEDPRLGPELHRAEIYAPEDFLGLFLAGQGEVDELVKDGRINTDDNARIEFAAPRDLLEYAQRDARLRYLERTEGQRLDLGPPHFSGFDFESNLGLLSFAERLTRQGRLDDAKVAIDRIKASSLPLDLVASWRLGRVQEILARFDEADQETVVVADERSKRDPDYALAVQQMLAGDEHAAIRTLDAAKDFEKRGPAQRFLYAYLSYRVERTFDAEWLIQEVLDDEAFVKEVPSVLYYAARIQTDRGRYDRAYSWYVRFLDQSRTATVGTSTAPGTRTASGASTAP
ncbi:MAG: fused MFS/spermidine synthase [Deltaproteobacteria bacterium]|nr:fused MFS/spermidine synthase [Deltaproteobacteria bacterium]